jgi:hypothetical protein
MVKIRTDEKVYPIVKIAHVVDALKETGVPPVESLRGSCISEDHLYRAALRVSLDQVVEVYCNAVPPGTRRALRLRDGAPLPHIDLQHVWLRNAEQH